MTTTVLTRAQLIETAGSPGRARGLLDQGSWVRLLAGAYAPAAEAEALETRTAAAMLALPEDTVLGGRTALWVAGVSWCEDAPLEVTVPRGRHLAPREGLRWRSGSLPEDEVCQVGGLTILSAARVVVDIARAEPLLDAVAVLDAALRAGATTLPLVAAALARASRLRGVERARLVPGLANGRSESPMESRLRVRFVQEGVTGLECQWDAYDLDGRHLGRTDLRLRGLVGEYDGRKERLDAERFQNDRSRQAGLLSSGVELRRYTARDVYRRSPVAVAVELRSALRQSDDRPPPRVTPGRDTLPPPKHRPLPTVAEAA